MQQTQYPPPPGEEPDNTYDPLADTLPIHRFDPLAETRYHQIMRPRHSRRWKKTVRVLTLLAVSIIALFLTYLLAPNRINILILGIDARPGEENYGRSDTIILSTILPLRGSVRALSIPRDLWVTIPGYGENRINTAHFFGELEAAGNGPNAAMKAIQHNFGVKPQYFLRIRFDGFREFIDALGGIDVEIPRHMSGYPAGVHHLDGEKALALARDRSGSDDFFRMERGQIVIRSVIKHTLKPTHWPRLFAALPVLPKMIDANIPFWQYPRIALVMLRAGSDGIDTKAITRDMITPFTTDGGANVLLPNWDLILPVVQEMFGK